MTTESTPVVVRNARPCVSRARLEARLLNDRYSLDSDHDDISGRMTWNAAIDHVRTVILPALDQHERVLDALRELRDAPALDMRLKHALCIDVQADCEQLDSRRIDSRFDFSEAV